MSGETSMVPDSTDDLITAVVEATAEEIGEQNVEDAARLADALESGARELRTGIRRVKETDAPSLTEASEIMGRDLFFGPEAAEKAWGVKLTAEQIPTIPFSREELERARQMGQMLILRVKTAPDGSPLSMKKMNELLKQKLKDAGNGKVLYEDEGWKTHEEFFNQDTPELEWALATKGILPESTNKNDLEQTQLLADYVRKVFEGMEMPAEYAEALAEFDKEKTSLAVLFRDLNRNWQEAIRRTSELKLNQLFRKDPSEELYDALDVFQNTGERINERVYARSGRRSSDGGLVRFGAFDREGAYVGSSDGRAIPAIGVSFSRSR